MPYSCEGGNFNWDKNWTPLMDEEGKNKVKVPYSSDTGNFSIIDNLEFKGEDISPVCKKILIRNGEYLCSKGSHCIDKKFNGKAHCGRMMRLVKDSYEGFEIGFYPIK